MVRVPREGTVFKMNRTGQGNYEYTEYSTYSKVDTTTHKGLVSCTSSTKTTQIKCNALPLLGKSAPRYKPNDVPGARNKGVEAKVSKKTVPPKASSPADPAVAQMISKTSCKKVMFVEARDTPATKIAKPCTKELQVDRPEFKTRAQKVPTAELPNKVVQKTAIGSSSTSTIQASAETVKLCEVLVPHSGTLAACLGNTSGKS
ncbi:hypothetical protein PCANC_18686 [Puccinia coronata f. sp. avenae]|uniref:Uncharacterized protein n=1 Tax=Puccinia coronata f. sp. avenae TaxID=200324 RepID=A0A2N5VCB6_9BASI|nr:hypothetical protein PCANC_18686 [Puccinia coronata f. sp. avenae]